jgi:uncharacterized membrane protein YjgN (DUF898 family)
MQKNNKFDFNGDGAQFFGILFINGLLTMVTLGIYLPWALVKEVKFLTGNISFSGRNFSYSGEGKDIFIGFLYVLGALILMVGLMFISPYLMISAELALIFVGLPYLLHSAMTYDAVHTHWNEKTFEYNGVLNDFVKLFATNLLLTMVTLGIYGSWARVAINKYVAQHYKLGRLTFDYEGDGTELFIIMLKGFFLTVITFGIYGFWFVRDLNVYNTSKTIVYQDGKKCNFNSSLTVGNVVSILLVGTLLIMITFGIGFAWVQMRNMKIMLSSISISDELDPENIG